VDHAVSLSSELSSFSVWQGGDSRSICVIRHHDARQQAELNPRSVEYRKPSRPEIEMSQDIGHPSAQSVMMQSVDLDIPEGSV
jgi:hypothetical protein